MYARRMTPLILLAVVLAGCATAPKLGAMNFQQFMDRVGGNPDPDLAAKYSATRAIGYSFVYQDSFSAPGQKVLTEFQEWCQARGYSTAPAGYAPDTLRRGFQNLAYVGGRDALPQCYAHQCGPHGVASCKYYLPPYTSLAGTRRREAVLFYATQAEIKAFVASTEAPAAAKRAEEAKELAARQRVEQQKPPPSVNEQRDEMGRLIIRGPVGTPGVYRNVHIISDTVGVDGRSVLVTGSVIEAPVCVRARGPSNTITHNTLKCNLCIEFVDPVLIGNDISFNTCSGRLTNRPDVFGR